MAAPRRGLGRRGLVVLAVLLGLLAGWVVLGRRQAAAPGSSDDAPGGVLSYIPKDAFLVAVVDVDALRATPIGSRFLGRGRNIAGLGQIGELCGKDPMDGVRELAIAVPSGDDGGFGFFAAGSFEASALLTCAEKIVAQRGGRPVRQSRGVYGILSDASLAADSARLAVADGGPVLLGDPAYVQASLSLADAGESVRDAEPHRALRELVEPGVVVMSVVFSDEQRRALSDELRVQRMADSPFRALSSAALSVRLDGGGEGQLRVHGVLRCDRDDACADIAKIIARTRDEQAATPVAVAVGLSSVLSALRIEPQKDAVHLALEMPLEAALTLIDRLAALRQLAQNATPPEPEPPTPVQSAPLSSGSAVVPDAGVRIEAPK